MPKFHVRTDDALYERLQRRARGAGLPRATFCCSVLTEAADPQGRYIYSSQDEILGMTLQILAILATSFGTEEPAVLEAGLKEAREMLAERRLLAENVQR